jgi:hypothetical protein
MAVLKVMPEGTISLLLISRSSVAPVPADHHKNRTHGPRGATGGRE